MFLRPQLAALSRRLREPRRFIQVLAGPRQVGKTTLARQAIEGSDLLAHYASADEPSLRDRTWVEAQWDIGRLRARDGGRRGALLVLDEVQKVPGWSGRVKRLWDEDTAAGIRLRVVLLGSAPLLVQRGLSESLAGRFELIRVAHWSFTEMREAFGFDLERYVYFGGYPGAAPLIRDRDRWARYIQDSLVETTVSRDILCSRAWTSRHSSGSSSVWGATTRGRCLPTRRCSGSFRTPGIRRRWRTTSNCSRVPAC